MFCFFPSPLTTIAAFPSSSLPLNLCMGRDPLCLLTRFVAIHRAEKRLLRCFSTSSITMAPRAVALPREVCDALGLKPDESAFREGSATIVLPSKEAAFLNPVQEFNRDLSTLAIRAWGDLRNEEKRDKFEKTAQRRARKRGGAKGRNGGAKRQRIEGVEAAEDGLEKSEQDQDETRQEQAEEAREDSEAVQMEQSEQSNRAEKAGSVSQYTDYRFTVLEALSATGLRSIRYAREIPLLKSVLANDLSSSAVDAMKRNVALNFPADRPLEEWVPSATEGETSSEASEEVPVVGGASVGEAKKAAGMEIHPKCKVKINEGDAMSLMYAHRDERKRFDVVDLDPYGSAAMFLDGAVQSVADGGLLCVTCTDSAVLAGTSYPEKCFSAYGGVTTRVEYCHEFALRLVLHAISTSASRYGRYIEPMLCLSIDFYVRLFVRVYTRPVEVKKLASQTGAVFTCHSCQNASELRFGRHTELTGKDGKTVDKYHGGPGSSVGSYCEECGGNYLLAGPMWLGRLHNRDFCQRMLSLANEEPLRFKTLARINGMVGIAAEELQDTPFYLTPARISGFFHCNSPPLLTVVSALLHAGHQVSRSHCAAGSIKTTASRKELFDLWRCWIKSNPVKMESISPTSPAMRLLTKTAEREYNLTDEHADAKRIVEGSGKGTRYQMNPLPFWGPGSAAKSTPRSGRQPPL